jgi:hypothetical protein
VVAHSPALVLVAPPPVDERPQRAVDAAKGYPVRRSAANTRAYAAAVRRVGADLGLPVVDLWTRFAELAGWREGDEALPGSAGLPANAKLAELMVDGESPRRVPGGLRVLTGQGCTWRPPATRCCTRSCLPAWRRTTRSWCRRSCPWRCRSGTRFRKMGRSSPIGEA